MRKRETKSSKDGEYVQKMHIYTTAIFVHSLFLNYRMRALLVCLHMFLLRNVANKEKNGRCATSDFGYVVVEIIKEEEEKTKKKIRVHHYIFIINRSEWKR